MSTGRMRSIRTGAAMSWSSSDRRIRAMRPRRARCSRSASSSDSTVTCPTSIDLDTSVNMHGTFVAAGPGIRHSTPVAGINATDLAPTLAYLLGIDRPQNASGRILHQITTQPGFKTLQILDISDYHGQLVPLTDTSDNLALPGVNPPFSIGGSAFLKPWFDTFQALEPTRTITVAAGDSVGATPPISAFFGDTPTIEIMNLMGIDLDGLGNHNFDKGQAYLRETLIPLADFKYVSANVIDPATGEPPAEWSKSRTFTLDGINLAIIGFTNEDAPTLVFPDSFDPFVVTDATAAVNKRASQLAKQKKIGPIVAMGHLGATDGTLTAPTGPAVNLADNVTNVDVVIGDHTDQQVMSRRSNGTLLVENRSKGLRFTRVSLVVNPATRAARVHQRRLPSPVDDRRHPGPGHPGRDRRTQRPAGPDPRDRHWELQQGDPAIRPVRSGGRPPV